MTIRSVHFATLMAGLMLARPAGAQFSPVTVPNHRNADKCSIYLYEDTKRLVTLVEDAAGLLETCGTNAFADFRVPGSKWFKGDNYLFVYDVSGTCLFHAVTPELEGKNLIGFKDMNGKAVTQLIVDVGKKTERDASGWVFYLWQEGAQFMPVWKSSYIRKVVLPDGRICVVGSGSYSLKIEKAFIQERVTLAADLLVRQGKEQAFREFRNPGSAFNILDTYIFVMDSQGHALVDPSYPVFTGRDMKELKDAVGRYVVKDMLQKLETANEAWVQYLWPKRGATVPSRKLVYIRKVKVGEETLIVGSDFSLATPIWMKP